MKKLPTIPEIRHSNLRREMGTRPLSVAELARQLEKETSQVGQFAGPTRHKGIGDDMARQIEEVLGLSPYDLDIPATALTLAEKAGTHKADAWPIGVPKGKLPVVGVTAAGAAMEIIDLYQPGTAEEWLDAPGNPTPNAFILKLDGFSMQPKFWSGDKVLIEPALEWKAGDFVFAKKADHTAGTFKKLIEEEGRLFLFALNEDFKPRIQEIDDTWMIVGKATWRFDQL